MRNKSTPARLGLTAALLLGVMLIAAAANQFSGLKIGPNPSTTNLEIVSGGDIIFKEKSDHASTPGAGFGYLWVENTTPSTLVFTDDAGTDTTLGSGGGGSFDSATITGKTQAIPVAGDFIIGTDASDGDALKKFDIDDILSAGGGITDGATLGTGLTFPNTGLHILDTNASHDLILAPGSNITADRTLTITTGDADRALTISGTTDISGTNTGDVSLAGTPDYITISGQVITRNAVDLAADVMGELPDANVSNTLTASKLVGSGSTTDAVDLGTAEVAGDLAFSNITQIGQYEILGRVASGTGDFKALTRVEQDTRLEVETELTSSSNATAWNSDGVRFFHDTLTENTTVSANSGTLRANQFVQFRFTAATGSDYTLAWNSLFAAGSGVPFAGTIPTVTTVDGRQSVYLFQYRGSKLWLCAHREDN